MRHTCAAPRRAPRPPRRSPWASRRSRRKIILPTKPEQPLRSSASGSGFAFIACIAVSSSDRSPSGDSMVVHKKSRPPISAAPSISTPFLPPSLITVLSSLSFAASPCPVPARRPSRGHRLDPLGHVHLLGRLVGLGLRNIRDDGELRGARRARAERAPKPEPRGPSSPLCPRFLTRNSTKRILLHGPTMVQYELRASSSRHCSKHRVNKT